jgi:hypothetical protein
VTLLSQPCVTIVSIVHTSPALRKASSSSICIFWPTSSSIQSLLTQDEKSYPDYDLIDFVYNSTAYTSPLRKLIRDGYIHSVDYNWVDDLDKQRLQVDFIHDLVREVWTLNRDSLDKTVREVYESDYMQHSGDRYHQPVGESA